MGTVYDNIRNMSASALLGIKRSASKQDLQNILDGLESASHPDAKTISPEFDSSMLTPSMIGKAEDNLKTVSSTESMSQFLGQAYPFSPPSQLQTLYSNISNITPGSMNGSRPFNNSPTLPNTEHLHQNFSDPMFGSYAPSHDLQAYHTALNPPGPITASSIPHETTQLDFPTTSGRSKKNAAPEVPTRVSGRKRTVTKLKTTDSARVPLNGGRGKSRRLQQDLTIVNPVLKKQIVDAMNSKPQRGRKRTNLTVEERQELTRTRNRLHAKSTRERKKARLEELTKIEGQYKDLLARLGAEDERRRVVQAVISLRGQREPPPLTSQGPPIIDMEGKIFDLGLGSVGFEHCFDDPDSFTFKRPGKTIRGLTNLAKDNSYLIESITKNYDEKAAKSLSVSVYGGENGVALTRDFAFGQWEMKTVTNATAHAQTIAAGFFKVLFRPGLPKIMELEFSVDDVKMATSNDGNFEQLPSFPSVSSFPMNLSDANLMIHASSSSTGILGLSTGSTSSIPNMSGLPSFSSNSLLG